jgi:hypothetical protein
MNVKRNGASVVCMDQSIFVFGGNNYEIGSLDSIEKYLIDLDKWVIISLRMI